MTLRRKSNFYFMPSTSIVINSSEAFDEVIIWHFGQSDF
jgi:hypothetical protein